MIPAGRMRERLVTSAPSSCLFAYTLHRETPACFCRHGQLPGDRCCCMLLSLAFAICTPKPGLRAGNSNADSCCKEPSLPSIVLIQKLACPANHVLCSFIVTFCLGLHHLSLNCSFPVCQTCMQMSQPSYRQAWVLPSGVSEACAIGGKI